MQDTETGFYYLQSRYYDPEIARFINADDFASTGQGLLGNNMFAYCKNNPVIYHDSSGYAVETAWDIASLGFGVAELVVDPYDIWNWIGLAGDVADVLIPCVGGIGEATRVAKAATQTAEALESASDVKKGWKVGEDITNLTKAGKHPSWDTVRRRYWKNEAHFNSQNYSDADLTLMRQGKAPLVEYNGTYYPMELHHKQPRHKGGSNAYDNLLPVTPWDHAVIDKFRHFRP